MSKNQLDDIGNKPPSFEQNMLQTAKGGGFLAVGSLFEFASRFVIVFFLARILGAEQYGLYNLAISAATVIGSFSSLGLDSAMIRYVAIQSRKKDDLGLWGTLQIGIFFTAFMGIIAGIGLYFLAEPLSVRVFHEPQLSQVLRLFAIIVPFLSLSNVLADAARGFKRMDYAALAENGVQFTVRMVLIGILAFIKLDVFVASIVFGISDLASTLVLIYFLNKEFSFRRPFSQARYDFREIFTYAATFWVSGVLTKFRKNIDTFFLGALSTITNVGIFTVATRINLIGHVTYVSLIASVKPILAELFDQKNLDQLGKLYTTSTRWTFMANVPIFLIMVLYPDTLMSIFGESFAGGSTALAFLAWGELVNAGTGICGSIIDMTGFNKMKLVNSVVWVSMIIGLNAFLIPRWGVVGAAAAVFGGISIINILRVIEIWILMRLLPYDRTFLKPIIAGLSSFISAKLLNFVLPATNIWNFILHGLLVLGVYIGFLWIMGIAPEDKTVILRILKRSKAVTLRNRDKKATKPS